MTHAHVPFLLRELALEPDGRALTPWFAQKKNGRLYRYDLPTREKKEHAGAWAGRFIRLHLLETFIPWTLVKRGVKREVIILLDAPEAFREEAAAERQARKASEDSALVRALRLAHYSVAAGGRR